MKRLGLYIHIPFCRSKCLYCDFCSFPHRDESVMRAYVDALCADLRRNSSECAAYTVDTVYFGGGTPTLLPAELLAQILETVFACYRVGSDCEISAECNPKTAGFEGFQRMHNAGFNRLSIGLQSAHERELKALGRLHSFADFAHTVEQARLAGFANIGADVMFGIPCQTVESYLQTLEHLVALSPEHVSAYGLTVEEGTPFGRMGDRLILPDEEQARRMYFEGAELLEKNGYLQDEISNFARAGYESRHNLKYWNCEEYLGFGPAAYSDFGGRRFGNSRNLDAYLAGADYLAECEEPSQTERMNEYVMLRMRLAAGVKASAFEARFGASFSECFGKRMEPYVCGGFLTLGDHGAAFTRQGMYVSNAVLCEVLDFLG